MDKAIVFGEYQNLVGTVTEPAHAKSSVAAIFLTPGMLHHAGPYRLHVDLAREIAASNILSLRFDLSGIGESLGVGQGGQSIDRAANETKQAMDFITAQYGIEKFVLFGLCSGADDSVHTAVNDDRVVGLVTMDGCGYRTKRFYWHRMTSHYGPRMMMPSKWSHLLQRIRGTADDAPATLQMGTDVREFPSRDDAAKEFQALVNRGVQMHFVYTGGIADYYNYANQFFDMFNDVTWNGLASTTYFSQMDHVAMLCEDRDNLVADVTSNIIQISLQHDRRKKSKTLAAPVAHVAGIDTSVAHMPTQSLDC